MAGAAATARPRQMRGWRGEACAGAARVLDDHEPKLPPTGGSWLRSGAELEACSGTCRASWRPRRRWRRSARSPDLIAPNLPAWDVPEATTNLVAGAHRPRALWTRGGLDGDAAGPVGEGGEGGAPDVVKRPGSSWNGNSASSMSWAFGVFPHRPRHLRVLPARTSWRRGADRRRIRWCASRWASPTSTRFRQGCCSSGSCRPSATGAGHRPDIESGRREEVISTSTGAMARQRGAGGQRDHLPAAWCAATRPGRWGTRRASSTPG